MKAKKEYVSHGHRDVNGIQESSQLTREMYENWRHVGTIAFIAVVDITLNGRTERKEFQVDVPKNTTKQEIHGFIEDYVFGYYTGCDQVRLVDHRPLIPARKKNSYTFDGFATTRNKKEPHWNKVGHFEVRYTHLYKARGKAPLVRKGTKNIPCSKATVHDLHAWMKASILRDHPHLTGVEIIKHNVIRP